MKNLKKFANWVKKNPVASGSMVFTAVMTVVALSEGARSKSLQRKNVDLLNSGRDLKARNKELSGEVYNLRGENDQLRNSNRKLSRENSNLNYQLGKSAAQIEKSVRDKEFHAGNSSNKKLYKHGK